MILIYSRGKGAQEANRPVYVAFTNTRYGKVPNVSLIPVKDCGRNSRYCSPKCYGVRNYRMYEATRTEARATI